MPLLPRTTPDAALTLMDATLGSAGIKLGPLKAGTRLTHTVQHAGSSWELTYLGPIGWRLTGPGAEHGIGVGAEEAAVRIAAPAAARDALKRTVYVRPGTHGRAYHPDPACPALNGKPETEARGRGLTCCGQCENGLSAAPQTYAGVAVPALVRAA